MNNTAEAAIFETQIKPDDYYGKAEIPQVLKLGYARFYKLMEFHGFPEHDGIYKGKLPSHKSYPCWHIDTLTKWNESIQGIPIGKPRSKPGHHYMIDKLPWAVPEHTPREIEQCKTFNQLHALMSKGLQHGQK